MKEKATVTLRRKASGEVVGKLINHAGQVVESRNFGVMSVEEFERVLRAAQEEDPSVEILPAIELTGN